MRTRTARYRPDIPLSPRLPTTAGWHTWETRVATPTNRAHSAPRYPPCACTRLPSIFYHPSNRKTLNIDSSIVRYSWNRGCNNWKNSKKAIIQDYSFFWTRLASTLVEHRSRISSMWNWIFHRSSKRKTKLNIDSLTVRYSWNYRCNDIRKRKKDHQDYSFSGRFDSSIDHRSRISSMWNYVGFLIVPPRERH